MTITADQAKRIATFDSAHSQVLDNELLYMVMQNLATVRVITQNWTGKPLLVATLTGDGEKAWIEFHQKQNAVASKGTGT